MLAPQATSASQAVALLCLAAVLYDLAIPVLWVISADLGGRYVGTVSGLMNMIGAIGGMLSPVLIPYLVKKFKYLPPAESWQIILIILAIGWFCSACLCLLINAGKPIFAESDPTAEPRADSNE